MNPLITKFLFIILFVSLSLSLFSIFTSVSQQTIVTLDIMKVVRQGQSQYSSQSEIIAFSKRLDLVVFQYAKDKDVVILSNQIVIQGAKDVTDDISKLLFKK